MAVLCKRAVSLPTRSVSPLSSTGGLARISARRFSGLPKPKPETRTSPWTWNLLSGLPTMVMSPETLLSSRRMGPETSRERSKLPETEGPIWQPARATASVSNAMGAARSLVGRIIRPPAPYRRFLALICPSPSLINTQRPGKMFRIPSGPRLALVPRKSLIQRALPIAFEIERDVGEACCFQASRDRSRHFERHGARHFVRGDFDAGEPVVQAYAKLAEAQVA